MIRYALKCDAGHAFESWFQSSEAFDRLARTNRLACISCGSVNVEKALMAPRVGGSEAAGPDVESGADSGPDAGPDAQPRPLALSEPGNPVEAAMRRLRLMIETKAENVGRAFASEARAIHDGEVDARPIYGLATGEEARELLEDGVPVAPLPWFPRRDD